MYNKVVDISILFITFANVEKKIRIMTQEEKQILLTDLCARLPYRPQCQCKWTKEAPNGTAGCIQELSTFVLDEIEIMDDPKYDCQICDVKPYLRPMSSMTKEEQKELEKIIDGIICYDAKNYFHSEDEYNWNTLYDAYDWLNKHHFDYRGLIEKGLALEAPIGMYK